MFPTDAPRCQAEDIVVEVRDVSVADAPSAVVAAANLPAVNLEPGARLPFEVDVPEVDSTRSLSLRVHVNFQGAQSVKPGDLISTASYPIPANGTPPPITVAVRLVS